MYPSNSLNFSERNMLLQNEEEEDKQVGCHESSALHNAGA
jgi:hypothetical protein